MCARLLGVIFDELVYKFDRVMQYSISSRISMFDFKIHLNPFRYKITRTFRVFQQDIDLDRTLTEDLTAARIQVLAVGGLNNKALHFTTKLVFCALINFSFFLF